MLRELGTSWSFDDIGFAEQELPIDAGARGAEKMLRAFMPRIDRYHETRDVPGLAGTSSLSVHLRFGTISIRELVRRARAVASEGARKWLDELLWREFYQMILDRFPHVERGAFRPEYDAIRWPGAEEHYEAWCAGRTGYPIVDAAMRGFNATGMMHNRLRMIVASFLTKDLLVDYRRGERYFARHLLDFDLASNNGNWQWAASTGCDAQPFFRVFNPVTQSKRFDPDGTFIRAHCPELAGFSNRTIHFPADAGLAEQRAAGCIIGEDYPAPIVDHARQRELALALGRGL
jgi:deoxyribodipyrimidine photo-lyase